MKPVQFTPDERRELLRLGLSEAMVHQIEVDALPIAKESLSWQPSRSDVRAELREVTDAIKAARDAIEALLAATSAAPARLTARSLLPGGGLRHREGGMRLAEASKRLDDSLSVLQVAESCIPDDKPLRRTTASHYPVELIHNAMQLGSLIEGADPHVERVRPSSSPTSRFRQVVGICYQAIGADNTDPERAIKAYMTERRKLNRALQSRGSGTERPRQI